MHEGQENTPNGVCVCVSHLVYMDIDPRISGHGLPKMADVVNRVFMWCVPRSVSTALLRCLSFVEGLQVVNEPYQCAFYSGPERKNPNPDLSDPIDKRLVEMYDYKSGAGGNEIRGFDESVCTYAWIRDQLLEAAYPEKKILLCKDIVYHLDARFHELPKGFKYSFVIRHPAKVFSTWKKAYLRSFGEHAFDNLRKLPPELFPAGCGFKELYELMEFVQANLDPEPVVIDTDDLLADPPGILSAYCHRMGIPYSPELLSWKEGDGSGEDWITAKAVVFANSRVGFFQAAYESSGFRRPEPPPAVDSLPADVQACVEASMEYYGKLRERRIQAIAS